MNAVKSKHLAYSEVLSLFTPRILMSRSQEETSTHTTDFLIATNGLIDEHAKLVFQEEVEYLWQTFPRKAKTLDNYRKLVQVLLAQAVDFQWFSEYPRYRSDQDVEGDESLCSFRKGATDFEVKFTYVQYYEHIFMRIPNSLRLRYRRLVNHPGRHTQGLRTTRCKKAMVGLINQISEDIARKTKPGREFQLMVNSLLRTEAYQNALAQLGYAAPRHSAHLVGYAADLEKLWYEQNDGQTHKAITEILTDLFAQGTINLIEEETHWHICLNPIYIKSFETVAQNWVRK